MTRLYVGIKKLKLWLASRISKLNALTGINLGYPNCITKTTSVERRQVRLLSSCSALFTANEFRVWGTESWGPAGRALPANQIDSRLSSRLMLHYSTRKGEPMKLTWSCQSMLEKLIWKVGRPIRIDQRDSNLPKSKNSISYLSMAFHGQINVIAWNIRRPLYLIIKNRKKNRLIIVTLSLFKHYISIWR